MAVISAIDLDEYVIYNEQIFNPSLLVSCKKKYEEYSSAGKILSDFEDNLWTTYNDIKRCQVNFLFDEVHYRKILNPILKISSHEMIIMLKCYAVCLMDEYIFSSVSSVNVKTLIDFFGGYGNKNYKITKTEKNIIRSYLAYINIPEDAIRRIITTIDEKNEEKSGQRQLANLANYLVIADEINELFSNPNIDDQLFIKWFPVYFWCNITFILPLRPSEMMVTPLDCIEREGEKVYITVRRTRLKKREKPNHDISDFKQFTYNIPDSIVIKMIEKYIEKTKDQDRRFLFKYPETSINKMMSVASFNYHLSLFIEEYLIGNDKYDFVRFASQIDEFSIVTAGDSRPIALSNLYFQDIGADLCRQLADHENIDVTAGYFTNISETIWASSIVRIQKEFDKIKKEQAEKLIVGYINNIKLDESKCISIKRALDDENIEDCIEMHHLEECMGCPYYIPSNNELIDYEKRLKDELNHESEKMIEYMNSIRRMKGKEETMEELFLKVQSAAVRYKGVADQVAKEIYKKWEEK